MKIRCIIFDLDGVLVDTKTTHYLSLNLALESVEGGKYVISLDDHLRFYDGLPTLKKLQILTEKAGLPKSHYEKIRELKQIHTLEILQNDIKFSSKVYDIISQLKNEGYYLCVASNSVRQTVNICLKNLAIENLIDAVFSNEDVLQEKPNAEIYLRCMISGSFSPRETLVIEDSQIGRLGVYNSGANLCPVTNPDNLTLEKIKNSISEINLVSVKSSEKWKDDKLTVLIPMAGAGSRFAQAGYTFPKPLVEVHGKSMIQVVVENLNIDANYVFIVQKEHHEKYNLNLLLSMIAPGCKTILVDGITEGAACTTLLAKQYINNENQLLIANSDQYVEWNSSDFMYYFSTHTRYDGSILTFKNTHPKWSYIKQNENGDVIDVKEKQVISDNATVGIYYWRRGVDYVKYAEQMITKDIRHGSAFNGKGEFYVAPVYNEAIKDGKVIGSHEVKKMYGLGTPEDLNYFLKDKT